jgi:hypothetical protein
MSLLRTTRRGWRNDAHTSSVAELLHGRDTSSTSNSGTTNNSLSRSGTQSNGASSVYRKPATSQVLSYGALPRVGGSADRKGMSLMSSLTQSPPQMPMSLTTSSTYQPLHDDGASSAPSVQLLAMVQELKKELAAERTLRQRLEVNVVQLQNTFGQLTGEAVERVQFLEQKVVSREEDLQNMSQELFALRHHAERTHGEVDSVKSQMQQQAHATQQLESSTRDYMQRVVMDRTSADVDAIHRRIHQIEQQQKRDNQNLQSRVVDLLRGFETRMDGSFKQLRNVETVVREQRENKASSETKIREVHNNVKRLARHFADEIDKLQQQHQEVLKRISNGQYRDDDDDDRLSTLTDILRPSGATTRSADFGSGMRSKSGSRAPSASSKICRDPNVLRRDDLTELRQQFDTQIQTIKRRLLSKLGTVERNLKLVEKKEAEDIMRLSMLLHEVAEAYEDTAQRKDAEAEAATEAKLSERIHVNTQPAGKRAVSPTAATSRVSPRVSSRVSSRVSPRASSRIPSRASPRASAISPRRRHTISGSPRSRPGVASTRERSPTRFVPSPVNGNTTTATGSSTASRRGPTPQARKSNRSPIKPEAATRIPSTRRVSMTPSSKKSAGNKSRKLHKQKSVPAFPTAVQVKRQQQQLQQHKNQHRSMAALEIEVNNDSSVSEDRATSVTVPVPVDADVIVAVDSAPSEKNDTDTTGVKPEDADAQSSPVSIENASRHQSTTSFQSHASSSSSRLRRVPSDAGTAEDVPFASVVEADAESVKQDEKEVEEESTSQTSHRGLVDQNEPSSVGSKLDETADTSSQVSKTATVDNDCAADSFDNIEAAEDGESIAEESQSLVHDTDHIVEESAVQESEPAVEESESELQPEPIAVEQESEAAVEESEAAVEEPEAAVEEPEAAVEEPEAAVEEPEAAVEESEAAVEEPEAAVEEPEAAVEEPEAVVEESEAAVEEPEAAVEEPEPAVVEEPEPAVVEEPEPAVEEPEPAVEEPEAAVEESEPAVEEPEPAVEEPEPAVEEPEAAVEESEPAVEELEAAVEESEPAVEEPEPAVEEPEPAVEEPEPAVEEPEPAVEEPEPVVEEPEPAVEESEPTAEESESVEEESAVEEPEAVVEAPELAAGVQPELSTDPQSGVQEHPDDDETEDDKSDTEESCDHPESLEQDANGDYEAEEFDVESPDDITSSVAVSEHGPPEPASWTEESAADEEAASADDVDDSDEQDDDKEHSHHQDESDSEHDDKESYDDQSDQNDADSVASDTPRDVAVANAVIGAYDTNGDGKLDGDELEALRQDVLASNEAIVDKQETTSQVSAASSSTAASVTPVS